MHQDGGKKPPKRKKQKTKLPSPVPAGGCAETRTENRQQTGKMRISTVVSVVLSSGNWNCCPGIACHEPLAPKSWTCFNGLPQLNFPTCIHREGLGNTREAKTKACKLEVGKRLKRFHSPLENHSSSSASPKAESRKKGRKKNAGERCQQDHGQISKKAERKRKIQETQRRNGGEGPRLVEFLSFAAPKLIAVPPPPPPLSPPWMKHTTKGSSCRARRHPWLGRLTYCSASILYLKLKVFLPLPVLH